MVEQATNTKVEIQKSEGILEIFGKEEENRQKAVNLILPEISYARDEPGVPGEKGKVLKDERQPRPDGSLPEPVEEDDKKRGNKKKDGKKEPPLRLWILNREAGRV